MIETIQQFVVMYAPTVLMAIGTVVSYLTTFKALKTNVREMVDNSTIKGLRAEIRENKALLEQVLKDNAELKATERELINEISKVKKYENVKLNEKV